MKFLLEFIACWGSSSSTSMVKEKTSLLVAPAPPPPPSERCRIRGQKRGRRSGDSSSGVEWRPSLSSIREDNALHEKNKNENHPHHEEEVSHVAVGRSSPASLSSSERNLKRKITSTPKPRSYCAREDVRRPTVQAVMPTFSPAPFMF